MTTQTKALKLALEALEESHPEAYRHVIKAIKEALAQTEQEPVPLLEFYEYEWQGETHKVYRWLVDIATIPSGTKLYTTPPQPKEPEQKYTTNRNAWTGKSTYKCNICGRDDFRSEHAAAFHECREKAQPALTESHKRTWVGLTEQEAAECWSTSTVRTWQAIEAKLNEKNTK